ncbi:hypothetical protein GLOIN_2v1787693 [Rhizophagus irregularis DAOM 181602=DAOM 197198]|uniref:Uncharacterized protein n=1 Tax=Rhizophagus irregularis (strain DAOM 181602 / DAOM 197198 / MUCL 43194) TaxID=747089 RepID=A0A2P4P5C0_RHIID|nr:hypothetical protein GLOIN_2v1787693 [Rhizophagus irregularis DAOM 181602=DAOM 197198]POG60582.1 hypothetical protein GLOIN_2v1787693 [Rhizophagus irregularis DAOM 181602=DAOM 197198]|eukprot:XP_025167448.1 hypothetical protein GLOIN_2v1787693 [Rhizophagus irregularis DAOM 181602=DAOM 197198]
MSLNFDLFVESEYRELGAVAFKIFRRCVNAASVEKMCHLWVFLHTARHNLINDKVLAMSQLFEDSEVEYSEIPEDTENAEDNTNIII